MRPLPCIRRPGRLVRIVDGPGVGCATCKVRHDADRVLYQLVHIELGAWCRHVPLTVTDSGNEATGASEPSREHREVFLHIESSYSQHRGALATPH